MSVDFYFGSAIFAVVSAILGVVSVALVAVNFSERLPARFATSGGTSLVVALLVGLLAMAAGITALWRGQANMALAIAGIVLGSPLGVGVTLFVTMVITKPLKNAKWG